jgi:malonyl-ACP O-methyltransferase BioC
MYTMPFFALVFKMPRSYDKVASYERYSKVQARSFQDMLDCLSGKESPRSIVDIGCGTGARTKEWADRFPHATVIGIDLDLEKIESAQRKYPGIQFVNASIFECKVADTYDLIVSNASVQWMSPLEKALETIWTMLKKEGCFIASVFGPHTFNELDTVLNLLEKTVEFPSRSFPSRDVLKNYMTALGGTYTIKNIIYRYKFDSLWELLKSIQKTQTSGRHKGGLWTPGFLEKAEALYTKLYGGIYATYDVMVLHAKKEG